MSRFVLMRRDPNSKSFADWRIFERHDDFDRAVRSRERNRKWDKKYDDDRWEYLIETIPNATVK